MQVQAKHKGDFIKYDILSRFKALFGSTDQLIYIIVHEFGPK